MKEIFIGRVGHEVVLKYTPKLTPVCDLNVYTNDKLRRVTVWGELAVQCKLVVKKGQVIFIEGARKTQSYTSKDGEQRSYERYDASMVGFTEV